MKLFVSAWQYHDCGQRNRNFNCMLNVNFKAWCLLMKKKTSMSTPANAHREKKLEIPKQTWNQNIRRKNSWSTF